MSELYEDLAQQDESFEDLASKEADLAVRLLRQAIHRPADMRELIDLGTTEEEFLAPVLRTVWRKAVPVFKLTGRVDPILLGAELEKSMDRQHARQVMSLIMGAEPFTDGTNLASTTSFLRDRLTLKRIHLMGQRIAKAADVSDANPQALLSIMRKEIETILAKSTAPTGLDGAALGRLLLGQLNEDKTPWDAVPLGIPEIDRATGGGAIVGRSTVVIAGTGIGKTTFGAFFLANAVPYLRERGEHALFVTMESSGDELSRALGQQMARAKVGPGLGRKALSDLAKAAGDLGDWPITVEYVPRRPTAEEFCAIVRAHKRRHKIKIVYGDYLQAFRLAPSMRGPDGYSMIADLWRDLAESEGIAAVGFSQLSAEAKERVAKYKNSRIRDEDTAGSTQFSKDAATVIAIERKKESKDRKVRNTSRVGLLKNRFTGVLLDAFMYFDEETGTLEPSDENGDVGAAPSHSGGDSEHDEVWGDA